MKNWIILCILLFRAGLGVDFDCVFIGSSPICLFEALYQHHSGKTVLILERFPTCGGAWQSVDVCGVLHADLGCHEIGRDPDLKQFLSTYAGCNLVSLNALESPKKSPAGQFYFSKGCYELVHNLLESIYKTNIVLCNNQSLLSVSIFPEEDLIHVKTETQVFSAKKLFYTPMSSFHIDSLPLSPPLEELKYPHLYLLIQDATAPRFTYMDYWKLGASRIMNLTHFVDLAYTGQQLLVLQLNEEKSFEQSEEYLRDLKQSKLLDSSAYLLKTEYLTYRIPRLHREMLKPEWLPYLQELQTSGFHNMSEYIPKWKERLPPYSMQ